MAKLLWKPQELHLEGDFALENYCWEMDEEERRDHVASAPTLMFQVIIGDTAVDIRVMKVGGDEEAEVYKKFFAENMGWDIPDDAIWHASQYKGEPSMDGESFQSMEEVEDRVEEIFRTVREAER